MLNSFVIFAKASVIFANLLQRLPVIFALANDETFELFGPKQVWQGRIVGHQLEATFERVKLERKTNIWRHQPVHNFLPIS